jgi:hypothetical protein
MFIPAQTWGGKRSRRTPVRNADSGTNPGCPIVAGPLFFWLGWETTTLNSALSSGASAASRRICGCLSMFRVPPIPSKPRPPICRLFPPPAYTGISRPLAGHSFAATGSRGGTPLPPLFYFCFPQNHCRLFPSPVYAGISLTIGMGFSAFLDLMSRAPTPSFTVNL